MSKSLPIIGSNAAATAFNAAEVRLSADYTVFIDGNGKITAGNGTYAEPAPNALSLRHIDDCPGSTESCRAACYVHGLKKANAELYTLYEHNSSTIRSLMEEPHATRYAAAAMLGNWIRANCPDGFRWHVSGDVFSPTYARWIRDVSEWADVRCWIYTRSLWAIPTLMEAPRLSVLVSADRDNYEVAIPAARACGARVALLLDEVPYAEGQGPTYTAGAYACAMLERLSANDVVFPDYPIRPRACAEGPKRSRLWLEMEPQERKMLCPVDSFGASEHVRCGPCRKCFYRGEE